MTTLDTPQAPPREPERRPLDERTASPVVDRVRRPPPTVLRVLMVIVLIAGVVAAFAQFPLPQPRPTSAPAPQFAADRAMVHVRAIATVPRPFGSASLARARAYVVAQVRALGLEPTIQDASAVNSAGTPGGALGAGVMHNVIVRVPGGASTRAVLVVAHLDSGPTSPGAADNASSVGVALETLRALRAGPPLRNDVLVLFSDAEENGDVGARAFIDQSPYARQVGAFINLDNVGSGGPAYVTQMTKHNSALLDQITAAHASPAVFSWVAALVQVSGSGTEFAELKDIAPGYDSAFFANRVINHTALETTKRLDPAAVQDQGDFTLALTRQLGTHTLPLASSAEQSYFSIGRPAVVRYPQAWAIPLALALAVAFAAMVVVGVRRRRLKGRHIMRGVGVFGLALLTEVIVVSIGWIMLAHFDAAYRVYLAGGTYQLNLFGLIILASAVAILGSLVRRYRDRLGEDNVMMAGIGWWLAIGLLIALALPGLSPVFIWPGAFVLAAQALRLRGACLGRWTEFALLAVPAFVAVFMVTPLVALLQTALGMAIIGAGTPVGGVTAIVVTLAGGLLLAQLLYISRPMTRWLPHIAAIATVALVVFAVATNGWTTSHPRPTLAAYVYNADTNTAVWKVSDGLDAWSKQFFATTKPKHGSLRFFPSGPPQPALIGPAPVVAVAEPRVTVTSDSVSGAVRTLRLAAAAGRPGDFIVIHARGTQPLNAANLAGYNVGLSDGTLRARYAFGEQVVPVPLELRVRTGTAVTVAIDQYSNGLPDVPGQHFAPRPTVMIAAPAAAVDPTIVTKTFTF